MTTTILLEGYEFEAISPSAMHMVDYPVTLAFNGKRWTVSLINADNKRVEGDFENRTAAVRMIAAALSKPQFKSGLSDIPYGG